ncbi:fibronectin type-III domain-containing protein 3A-like isoform X1 [Scleropages formosus]|nr:fibronectin type-III domain-containing protein 3A-like isoform X1 [Scleropages formosus]XP_018592875.1 fibronectin type-III domain-containing protein 3A-like isoform X1 [Scleropages formosus]XP_018592876.1 fibronectin type-III domain-containing protein 3A-like isoform X1 [Scleropages formosus]
MLCFTMMTDQPHPPLEATPMLSEVPLVQHMLNGDSMQQMILVQVNPGETFTIRTEDGQVRCITGPAHVPMVSPNGTMPPIYVPPGYMSQVVEENGVRKVMVLPQTTEFHPSMPPPPPLHVPQYLPPHPAMLHQHHMYPREMPPHFMHQLPPPQMYSEQGVDVACHSASGPPREDRASKSQDHLHRRLAASSSVRITRSPPPSPLKGPSPAPPNNGQNGQNKGLVTPAASPGPTKQKAPGAPSPSDTENAEVVAEMPNILEQLSGMSKPTVLNVTSRSAILSWTPLAGLQNTDPRSAEAPLLLNYELALSRNGSDGVFSPIYLGLETTFTVEDLRPATAYYIKVCASCGSVKGPSSEVADFTTMCAPPEAPAPPRVILHSKSTLVLQWKAPNDNGSKITGYLLEFDEGKQSAFKEVYFGHAKQYKIVKLTPSTNYAFRIAAKNDIGMSAFSEVMTCCTAGSAPQPPAPPRLSASGVSWLTLEWNIPGGLTAGDTLTYTLEMEEEGTGYGFKPKYNGEELSCTLKGLRRSTSYRFRVLAANAEGRSQPSVPVEFSTTPDKPGAPGRPALRGRVQPRCLHTVWDAPKDDGGSPVTQYVLEMGQNHNDNGWEVVYSGPLREHVCDSLKPGTWYNLRVYCQSAGGQSQASESLTVQTAPVPPGPCQALQLAGKARPRDIPLTWGPPLEDGGAPVSQYIVEMSDSTQGPHRTFYQGLETDCSACQLVPGHKYCFWVKAANQAGWGPLSEMYEFSTAPGPPEPCGPPQLAVKTPTCVLASWEIPACNGAEVFEFRMEWGAAEGTLTLTYCGPAPGYEARNLLPATAYYCRVQAVNSVGAGPFGDVAMVTTPPSVPAAVRSVAVVGEDALAESLAGPASCLALRWEEPCSHGAEIIGYNIDFGEQVPISVGKTNHYILENLQPDTTYRVRVQAINGIGVGPFSASLKARTRPLPPEPPTLECAAAGPQSLKLKWGDGPSRGQLSGATQYCLHMQASADRLVCIYSGPCHTFKVQRLSEATVYQFSIQAHNEAGVGPLSPLYSFSTSRSPPPQLKAPRVDQLESNHYEVTWEALQSMRGDPIVYTLQLQRGRELEQLYRGPASSYKWHGVVPVCDWRLRVCAGRRCPDGVELWGPYSPSIALPGPEPPAASESVAGSRATSRDGVAPRKDRAITDEQFALLLLLGFAIVAILFAVLIQYFVIK